MGKNTKDISRLVRSSIRRLTAYHIDETPVRIKLDAMENPYPLPEEVRREIAEACENAMLNRYPDPSAKELKSAIAEYWGMEQDSMMLGNGSDELIQAIVLAFGGPVLFPTPSFAMYELTSRALSQKIVAVPLDKDFDIDPDRLIRKARQVKARVIFLACPNNPTGNRFSDDAVRLIVEKTGAAVVIDEAYYSFSGKTWLPALREYPNMVILRTLSKIGLAGLRVGIMAASQKVIEELNKVRLPYNINVLSQTAAKTALKHRDVLDGQISRLISERERLYNGLSELEGIGPYPSETNFILFRTEGDAVRIYEGLKQRGILIKNLSKPGPLRNCLRVTVGMPEENAEFLSALKAILDQA